MGLDIHLSTNNPDVIFTADYLKNFFHQHKLSRTFCNFMCRQHVVSHEPELDQIGKITGIDISPIYDMEKYMDEDDLRFFLDGAKTEEEKQQILHDAAASQNKLKGNIDKVAYTINELSEKLNQIENLPELLIPSDFYSFPVEEYFSDFRVDKGDGYIGNNFGQDLRNFQRFLSYIKSQGAETVWFKYG